MAKRVVLDSIAESSAKLYWDANGNLAQVSSCKNSEARFHYWTVKR